MVYNSLALGRRVIEAVRDGRQAMKTASNSGFVDWGIPVLYSRDPALVLRQASAAAPPAWQRSFEAALSQSSSVEALGATNVEGGPSMVVERTARPRQRTTPRCRVALVDLDAKVAFLPDLVEQVNAAQSYYRFYVAYLPVPSGAVRTDLEKHPQLFLPRIQEDLRSAPQALHVDIVCCLSQHYLAGEDAEGTFSYHLAASIGEEEPVVVIATGSLPALAAEAGVSFAKAVLCVCLSQIILAEGRWEDLDYHDETVGCLFDFCKKHADVVVGLQKMAFTHTECRDKIKDPQQLAAIDALIATDIVET
jgi:hypothetical protein